MSIDLVSQRLVSNSDTEPVIGSPAEQIVLETADAAGAVADDPNCYWVFLPICFKDLDSCFLKSYEPFVVLNPDNETALIKVEDLNSATGKKLLTPSSLCTFLFNRSLSGFKDLFGVPGYLSASQQILLNHKELTKNHVDFMKKNTPSFENLPDLASRIIGDYDSGILECLSGDALHHAFDKNNIGYSFRNRFDSLAISNPQKALMICKFYENITKLRLFIQTHPNVTKKYFFDLFEDLKDKDFTKTIIERASYPPSYGNPYIDNLDLVLFFIAVQHLPYDAIINYANRMINLKDITPKESEMQDRILKRSSNLTAHGVSAKKGNLFSLTNIMLEGRLRSNVCSAPLGTNSDYLMRDFYSGTHGPFYVLCCNDLNELAFLVPNQGQKDLVCEFYRAGIKAGICTRDPMEINERCFTYEEFCHLDEDIVENDEAFARYINQKIH